MAKKFPIDEFDSATVHGGRHRARRSAKDRVLEWIRIFVAAALVAGLGYGGLKFVENSSVFDGYLPSSNSSADASISAKPGVQVLDGGDENLAGDAGRLLKDSGFNVTETGILVDANDKRVKIKTTVVTITDELFRADAEAIAAKIGNPEVVISPEFAGPITVVLGSNYKLPTN
jgi:co-chaperonin GroES (HSP10)